MNYGGQAAELIHWHTDLAEGHGSVRELAVHSHHRDGYMGDTRRDGYMGDTRRDGYMGDTRRDAIAYLGGPMRGLPYFNFPAFDAATAELRAKGWTIHSPAEKDLDVLDIKRCPTGSNEELEAQHFSLAGALSWDFARINESSCVIFLPGWEKSTGCSWEATVAYALGKPVFQYPNLTPVELPEVVTNPVSASHVLLFMESAPQARVADYEPPRYTAVDSRITTSDAQIARDRGVDGPGAYAVKPGDAATNAGAVDGRDGEIRVIDPTTGGAKGQKILRTDLLPPDALLEVSRVFGQGAAKYADRNWEQGYAWGLSIGALKRHLLHWEAGEELDEEGHLHLAAVAWHALVLLAFSLRNIGTDDRPDCSKR